MKDDKRRMMDEGRWTKKTLVLRRSSLILHPSPLILHLSSLIPHPSSLIPRPSSLIPHPSSLIPLLLALALTYSCGNANSTGEDYGDLMNSPLDLKLTQEEHQSGWGKSTCNACHVFNNIHISLSESGFDMADVRQIVATGGLSSCTTHHGKNGVE